MATAVIIKHPNSGMIKIGYYGFSWTYLFLVGLCRFLEVN
ncbi:hypothetical protein EMGBS12_03130 [Methylophilaceae bacterium]|nr:hypothetical protein EMGBS12_03130 [Methylophilaceae bacterium]